jgi:arsenate reductase-like glutaredoxin family protein
VQIFGVKNSQATRAAERFFKERRVQIHYVDLQKKALAPGEIKRFTDRFGGLANLLDTEGKEFLDAGLKYLRVSDAEMLERIERTPKLLKLPLVRGPGKHVAIGHDEAAWKAMLAP